MALDLQMIEITVLGVLNEPMIPKGARVIWKKMYTSRYAAYISMLEQGIFIVQSKQSGPSHYLEVRCVLGNGVQRAHCDTQKSDFSFMRPRIPSGNK